MAAYSFNDIWPGDPRHLIPLQGQAEPSPVKDSLYDAEEASRNPEQLSGIVVFGSSGLFSCSSPASPRPAGPVGETPREGGGTAGGAGICCEKWQSFPYFGHLDDLLPQGWEPRFCLWCGLALDETGAIWPREGFLKRVLKRLWPVGGRDTSRKAL